MCGICGIYNYRHAEPVEDAVLRQMMKAMVHRGPDDEGRSLDGAVGLGMRRLSIIDLTTGHQPIHNEDQTIRVVFNGEIYNFTELRRELEANGHTFYTRSDTEVIVHGYEEWGDDCVLHFNGIFGFALWDATRQRLLLARDHFGVKPLYYYDDGSHLLWGSEIKAILTDPRVARAVDTEALDLFLTFRFVPSPWTMFHGIRKLPPGHRLICHAGGCTVERYWYPRPQGENTRSEQEQIEVLQERLEAAVRRQMISDVPVGALLSGGIDSAAIVAIMSQLTNHPIRTFTVGFADGGDANELNDARATAKILGTQHYEIELNRLDYQQLFPQTIWHLEEPISVTSALAMYCVCQLARQHVTVVLTGQGADEPHAGYPRYVGERYGHVYRYFPASVRERIILPLVELLPRQERLKRAVRSLGISKVSERFVQVYTIFNEEIKSLLWRPEHQPKRNHPQEQEIVNYWRQGVESLDPLVQMAYIDARLSLADYLLIYGDKMSMAASIEARVPFLDLDYMATAEALSASLRIRGLTLKYLHKKTLAKWLPAYIINRPKRGFDTPVDRWFRSELSGYVRSTLLSPRSACRTYFNADAIDALLRNHQSGRQDNRRLLFSLLVFELWHQQFITTAHGRQVETPSLSPL